ncbi:hypothetical protein T01_3425, partial [Trichinella spiralis]
LTDQVSTLCLPCRTPTVVRTADEPGGQQLQEMQDPRRNRMQLSRRKTQQRHLPRIWKQKMRLLTEPRLNSLPSGFTFPRLFGLPGSSFLSSKRWPTVRTGRRGWSIAFSTVLRRNRSSGPTSLMNW